MASVAVQRLQISLFFLLFWVLHFGLVRSDDAVKIGLRNLLDIPVIMKVKNRDGEVAIARRLWESKPKAKKRKVELAELNRRLVNGNQEVKYTLAHTPLSYDTRRPWFLWLQMQINASVSIEFVHDPLVESPSYSPGSQTASDFLLRLPCVEFSNYQWVTYGKGIFVTENETRVTGLTQQQTAQPTLLCYWEESRAPPFQSMEPPSYNTHDPLRPCSVYRGSWNPAWLSVANYLKKRVQVTIKKGDEISTLKVDVREGSPEWPSYGDRMISGSHEDYGKQRWRMVVRVEADDDPLRNFDVILIKEPMESELEAAKNTLFSSSSYGKTEDGWLLHVSESAIVFGQNGLKMHQVCVWKKEVAIETKAWRCTSDQPFLI